MAQKKTTKKKSSKTGSNKKPSKTTKSSKSTKKASSGRGAGGKKGGTRNSASSSRNSSKGAEGKHLVIVESPTKAKTINRYLGNDYHVMSSVGHVRDLPKSQTKDAQGKKQPVPGVDLEHDFEPSYEILGDSTKTVNELKRASKVAQDVWIATDLDREGEAIAWHLVNALDVPMAQARRVVFNAITQRAIAQAFENPRDIEMSRVNAQQARRILDRIVGYQVSPLLWKKVAGGLSAGRVQSVAVRLVVEREREIEAFTPDEYWKIGAVFSPDPQDAETLGSKWRSFIDVGEGENPRTNKDRIHWLNENQCLQAEVDQVGGQPFKPDNRQDALAAAKNLGFVLDHAEETEDEEGKGPAKYLCTYHGSADPASAPTFTIDSIETKRTTDKPPPPYITSTMQQAAASRMSFQLQRTMRVAQQLYQGVDLRGKRGQTGLITYMRTDSTNISGEALNMAREYIGGQIGSEYLPEKPNFYKSSNQSAQEAHEAIRPTDVTLTPNSIKGTLSDEQFKLYRLIWERFVACQMTPAQWDSTTVYIQARTEEPISVGGKVPRGQGAKGPRAENGSEPPSEPRNLGTSEPASRDVRLKANGRTLVFEGYRKIAGLASDQDLIFPPLEEQQQLGPVDITPSQNFTSPPPRYHEASLQKKLEQEGIGRPSTYAAIIQNIQDRKYVEQLTPRDRRLRATDLGRVVNDMLTEAFPDVLAVGFTRQMEDELDEVEDDKRQWRDVLHEFYQPFKDRLDKAHEGLSHAKAVTEPAPYECEQCGAPTMYRFGKNGRFLSCSRYPDCKYAAPIDRHGRPMPPKLTDILSPEDGKPMIKRTGRFGPFLATQDYPEVKYILKLDNKTGAVVLPKYPPLETDLPCPKCGEETQATLRLRSSKRGLWLSCSRYPKCRGRESFNKLDEAKQKDLEQAWAEHIRQNPLPQIKTVDGHVIRAEEQYLPKVAGEDFDLDEKSGSTVNGSSSRG